MLCNDKFECLTIGLSYFLKNMLRVSYDVSICKNILNFTSYSSVFISFSIWILFTIPFGTFGLTSLEEVNMFIFISIVFTVCIQICALDTNRYAVFILFLKSMKVLFLHVLTTIILVQINKYTFLPTAIIPVIALWYLLNGYYK